MTPYMEPRGTMRNGRLAFSRVSTPRPGKLSEVMVWMAAVNARFFEYTGHDMTSLGSPGIIVSMHWLAFNWTSSPSHLSHYAIRHPQAPSATAS